MTSLPESRLCNLLACAQRPTNEQVAIAVWLPGSRSLSLSHTLVVCLWQRVMVKFLPFDVASSSSVVTRSCPTVEFVEFHVLSIAYGAHSSSFNVTRQICQG